LLRNVLDSRATPPEHSEAPVLGRDDHSGVATLIEALAAFHLFVRQQDDRNRAFGRVDNQVGYEMSPEEARLRIRDFAGSDVSVRDS